MIFPASLFFLSSSVLLFEIDLSRLLSVSQFYHFAFMVVSLALLGYGASGTALSLFPNLIHKSTRQSLTWISLACGFSILGAYLLMNALPFDSFSIAWDPRQALIMALHYFLLTLPFFFSGLAVGLLLAMSPGAAGRTYAFNLLGSAFGCLLALLVPVWVGGEGVVVLSSGLAFLAALIALLGSRGVRERNVAEKTARWGWRQGLNRPAALAWLLVVAGLAFVLIDLGSRLGGQGGLALLKLRLSPYKSLSYILQQPAARVESQKWNAFSRVDVVSSPGIHSFPGLSYRYLQPLPAQQGVLVDGDDLSPVLSANADLQFSDYLSTAIAFQLKPQAETLVLGGRGGLDASTALAQGARSVDVVEVNPLIVDAAPIYADPRVAVILSDERSVLRKPLGQYDVILLSLNNAYHPIRSGAYSLSEDYRYTVEAFEDALSRLSQGGIFVVTRWLQNPPSEDLRLFALAVEALERKGLDPREGIVAFRGYNTATFLVKPQPFTQPELAAIRNFTTQRAFDLIYAPGIRPEETNRYNILPTSVYYQDYQALLETKPRRDFYRSYPFAVNPPTDDHPFFGHFFKWSQTGQVLSELGKTWQPFGGAGYFVILALLVLSILLASLLILLPVFLARFRFRRQQEDHPEKTASPWVYILYFSLIGFAYLFVEIPLIQKYILFLGQPSYAMSAVLFTLLLFSGLGSAQEKRIPLKLALALLTLLLLILPVLAPKLFQFSLGLSFWARLLLTVTLLAPVGFLMGVPFPAGIRRLEISGLSTSVAWMWAVNGSASVVSAVLAALLALTYGFTWVLGLGALCYLGALLASIRLKASPLLPA
jgi:spermidine synthase